MRLRPYIASRDFNIIRNWITDERTHAFWCANLTSYPLEEGSFASLLEEAGNRFGDSPFVATEDDGKVIGFFCYSVNVENNEGMLKFVMVDSSVRGRGIGRKMIRLAVKYAFEISGADAVHLNVFPENERAKRCYEAAGFKERNLTENAFTFKDESWGRCNMIIGKM